MKDRRSEWIAASTVVVAALALAVLGVWVFRGSDGYVLRSTAQLILSDRTTLGFVRLLIIAGSVFGLASIAVWAARGRWLRSISTTGLEVGEVSDSDRVITKLEARLRRAQEERDNANLLLERFLNG